MWRRVGTVYVRQVQAAKPGRQMTELWQIERFFWGSTDFRRASMA